MTIAGERINELLDELLSPMEGTTVADITPYDGSVWLFPTPRCTYGIDLDAVLAVVQEVHTLLYHHRRDADEVDDYRLLGLGMAIGTLARLGRLPTFHPPGIPA